ncbi:50S ribosomal protein L6 [archaeon]|jgi:large subunit ribosomal protein L6|nr:50S ribosomal protein L6 [archaeon]MBT4242119.1 50S ribosomal protein L6 [archaeon]MBT4417807.1 50S ribosomal protein L6 [archaeon]
MGKQKETSITKIIEIPEGITFTLDGTLLTAKKEDKEIVRKINSILDGSVDGNKITLKSPRTTKRDRKIIGTNVAHINNMIKGLTEGFKYKLQVANVHFPMNVSFDKANNHVVVKNFLGEKKDRLINVVEGVNVKVDKENIELDSHDIEKAGQTAANIEKGTKVRNKDRRIFQDGIFITEKPGRVFI